MGITGLIPFLEKASRRANVSEFAGCTVAIDSYCWLHKGAFACADKIVRGESTDIHIKYCLKYVNMLLSRNVKPILVFDGRHLPAKAMTESKRRESRDISKKRAAELLSLGKVDEARSYMRRSVDITHAMALMLIKECRKINVDCIVAPYEADAQLAYLNINNIAHLIITEDSDLILFGCSKVLFKMDLEGAGILVEASKIPLVMRCPIERYTFDKFRQMCILSGCDYLASLPGIGLAKARQFITATQDPNIVNALKKLPGFFPRSNIVVSDEYRESFLQAEATFKHQYVYDPLSRQMVRLTETEDDDVEIAFCTNAGEILQPNIAFQLALGNIDPFTLKKLDDWSPDDSKSLSCTIKTDNWKQTAVSNHPSMWSEQFKKYLKEEFPWQKKAPKKEQPIIAVPQTRPCKKVVHLVSKYVPETQDESFSIESLKQMYCVEPASKKQKIGEYDSQEEIDDHNIALTEDNIASNLTQSGALSPILKNSGRSFRKFMSCSSVKKLSHFPRTVMSDNIIESKFFNASRESTDSDLRLTENCSNVKTDLQKHASSVKPSRNPFKVKQVEDVNEHVNDICNNDEEESPSSSQKENTFSPKKQSPVLDKNTSRIESNSMEPIDNYDVPLSEESVVENTYPLERLITPSNSQESFGESPSKILNGEWRSKYDNKKGSPSNHLKSSTSIIRKSTCKVPGLRKPSVPKQLNNQPTLLSTFGFQKRPVLKR